ncbi:MULTISPECIES: hypothetical protein [unclassified Nostoc]|uniref:hypothetical protein n=1 Tax=unclassified Nostoc TaxID=2593658 RepID=UPI002AD3E073|nr:hypothetical protein [Nostoc sp. DedQUE03]MDZ7972660.1 hypothetical protein [Nostoc sp. DedQUE03]MDZ8046022.1 hypothetical protein [Nostoc sp. DedQUE02]
MKISAIVKGSICLLGLVSVGNILAAPASAGQASARGAVTIVRPSGSSISVSGEVVAAPGSDFNSVAVVVDGNSVPGTNQEVVTGITVTPGAVTPTTPPTGNAIQTAVATLLDASTPAGIEDKAALLKAISGVNGLGGLE